MEDKTQIKDISSYLQNMSKGIEDKLFFTKHLPKNKSYLFIDFGCADGTLIGALLTIMGDKHVYIGYDTEEKMISYARSKFDLSPNRIMFTSKWKEVESMYKSCRDLDYEVVLILSSVIHEIYAYGTPESITQDWNRILSCADYVCLRDMIYSEDMETADSGLNPIDAAKIFKDKVSLLWSFEFLWGKISSTKNLLHFLLKYRWTINWDREVKENYFPISVEQLLSKFKTNFNIIYLERFKVPFLEQCWKEDFNLEIDEYTHIKAIFQLKNNN